ncbi:hypothetical protein MAM1_0191c07670 [Mucor ambiguus]|uniref:Uncharacterized protein n=1 Tax=Mucor ambiguus TaxID=91626 RepID=A0A0C9N0R6_9FUNG|nr:hypothetical protein MAM1_0191c07670 [Mucor ambiguus]
MGRSLRIFAKTQQYIANNIKNGKIDEPKGAVRFSAPQDVPMTTSGVKSMFRKKRFKAERKHDLPYGPKNSTLSFHVRLDGTFDTTTTVV